MAKKRSAIPKRTIQVPTAEEAAFLKAIAADPEEDAPRLVYADWLEENGQPARAELIRVQVRLARMSDNDPDQPALAVRRRELILDAARALGPERFNRLIDSIRQVRARGRLRFWQEELMDRLAPDGKPLLTGPDDFIAVFDGVEPLPVTPPVITQEEFLQNPSHYYYGGGAKIEEEWIAHAWETVPEFRENVSYEFAREASKVGGLDGCRSHLEFLDRILPLRGLVELYERVRAESPHREPEFRPTFSRVFKERMAAFPPPFTKREIIAALGEELARELGVQDDPAYPD
jgi:uncharacterized protein (TIGR02996 family)